MSIHFQAPAITGNKMCQIIIGPYLLPSSPDLQQANESKSDRLPGLGLLRQIVAKAKHIADAAERRKKLFAVIGLEIIIGL